MITDTGRRIVLGADLSFNSAQKLTEVFRSALEDDCDELVIDASKAYWVSPFTACWFAALVDKLQSLGKSVTIVEPLRDNAKHQWHNLGISYYLGLSKERKAYSRLPSFPVTKLTEPSYALAGKVKDILASPLKGAENFHKALHFAVREIVENTFEHGQVDQCYICAYAVPTKNVVRLCILDTGIGIPDSMRQSAQYNELSSDVETVELASEYGVSSKRTDRGIGLYILRDVAEKNDGTLSILSGQALVEISSQVKPLELSNGFPGTIIKLRLMTKKKFHFKDVSTWEEL